MPGTLELSLVGSSKNVGPGARAKLRNLIKYYMSKPHPFTACVRDNTKRFGEEGAKRVCATLKDIGEGTTKWRKGGKAKAAWAAENALIEAASGDIAGLIDMLEAAQAVDTLQESKPLLTTVPNVQIIKTGIEYPLASGPATFTPDDLADAVAAQGDPSVPQPRIWIGHEDDKRVHGDRSSGIPSGEPSVGKVVNMRLDDDGHTVVGDLEGVPIWLANIMASAFPSRSIEGRWNVKTPTGNKWRMVISGLALLGVTWPGVLTIEDIPTLYTKKGPRVDVTPATPDQPTKIAAALKRTVEGQVNVEDLRRNFQSMVQADPEKRWWWMKAVYLNPNEVIVDDDNGSLFRMSFAIKGDNITWGKAQKVKIKYVTASHGGIEAEPVNQGREHVVAFSNREESQPNNVIEFRVAKEPQFIEFKLGGAA